VCARFAGPLVEGQHSLATQGLHLRPDQVVCEVPALVLPGFGSRQQDRHGFEAQAWKSKQGRQSGLTLHL
jgi:hypothetical protein